MSCCFSSCQFHARELILWKINTTFFLSLLLMAVSGDDKIVSKGFKMVKNRINFFWLTKSTNCIFFQSLRRVKIYTMKNFYSAKKTLIDNKLKANSSSCAWAIKICQHLRRVIYHEQQNSMQFLNICKKWWFFFVWA